MTLRKAVSMAPFSPSFTNFLLRDNRYDRFPPESLGFKGRRSGARVRATELSGL